MRISDWSSDVCSSDLPDDHLLRRGIEPHDIERLGLSADLDPAPLPDGIMDEALVRAEYAAVDMDDVAPIVGLGAQLLDQRRIIAIGDEADVLAVGLARDAEPQLARDLAHHALFEPPPRKAQAVELVLRGPAQEIDLVG